MLKIWLTVLFVITSNKFVEFVMPLGSHTIRLSHLLSIRYAAYPTNKIVWIVFFTPWLLIGQMSAIYSKPFVIQIILSAFIIHAKKLNLIKNEKFVEKFQHREFIFKLFFPICISWVTQCYLHERYNFKLDVFLTSTQVFF